MPGFGTGKVFRVRARVLVTFTDMTLRPALFFDVNLEASRPPARPLS